MKKQIKKLLIANRGEIALRIIQTCKKLGIQTVAVFSEPDFDKPFVKMADFSEVLSGFDSKETYLNQEKLIAICKKQKVDAVHPGYGFLSENPVFAKALEEAGIIFIGPDAKSIHDMGDKVESRKIMQKVGVPVIPGYEGDNQSSETLLEEARKIGFPVMIKASAGGGGKGMRRVDREQDFLSSLESAKREALNFFSNDRVFLEKFITSPRHIEVQVFGDEFGNYIHLYERDCSVQRKHQKVIEESPAILLDPKIKSDIYKASLLAVSAINYKNAGTVEFVVSQDGEFYFLEMNTRLQVEHPVTEMITGLDLVELQIRIAEGEALPFTLDSLQFPKISGHSIELRIYAEDDKGIPSSGILREFQLPSSSEFRLDSGVTKGVEITTHYDAMIAKLIVHGKSREDCIQKLSLAIAEIHVHGIPTNLAYLRKLINHPEFLKGGVNTKFIEEFMYPEYFQSQTDALEIVAMAHIVGGLRKQNSVSEALGSISPWHKENAQQSQSTFYDKLHSQGLYHYENKDYFVKTLSIENLVKCEVRETGKPPNIVSVKIPDSLQENEISDKWCYSRYGAWTYLSFLGESHKVTAIARSLRAGSSGKAAFRSPMPGKLISILVQSGDRVKEGTPLLIVEAMKMENIIHAPEDLIIEEIYFTVGAQVKPDEDLLKVSAWKDESKP
jgi:3-methylcrotonyl-CoA carboxylase alpha subunit